ncbi:MAG: nuclear transport factor 2 family protein [Steroidobacteraceae bacterium]|jgi:limonene-1,2-epoxide hydrolase|nr:nuclear transport factor 2 family protein [Steroidobacteraceae bacterium]
MATTPDAANASVRDAPAGASATDRGSTAGAGTRTPLDTVHAFLAAWNANDMDAVVACLHEDVLYHNVPMEPIRGREAVRAYLARIGGFEWVDWKLQAIAANGNTVLTERSDDFGLRGRTIRLPVMGAFEVEVGLIRAWRDYFDLAMYRKQLEADPERR